MTIMGVTHAQHLSNIETFSVPNLSGCAPFNVSITSVISLSSTISRQYTYEGESLPTLDTFHTFNTPGTYQIHQSLGQDHQFKFDTLEITVFDPVIPDFKVNQCSGNEASVTASDNNYDFYRVYFSANDSLEVNQGETTPSFAFGSSGTQQIRVKGFYNDGADNCGESTKSFDTINQFTPAIINTLVVSSLDNTEGAIQLNFNMPGDIDYELELAENSDSDFQPLQGVRNNVNLTISGLQTDSSYYCFRVSVFDACQNQRIYSNTLCSTALQVQPNEGYHQLSWQTGILPNSSYELIKDGQLFKILDETMRSLRDSIVFCGVENCYSINATNGTSSSISAQVCASGLATANAPPIIDITASVDGEDVTLSWTIVNMNPEVYIIRRSRGKQPLEEIDRTSNNSYTDNLPGVNLSPFKYDVFYEDDCGNSSSESVVATTVHLSVAASNGNIHRLAWNPYEGWFSGVANYFLQKLNVSGGVVNEEKILSGFTQQVALTNLDNEPVSYRIKIESLDDPAKVAYSNTLILEFIPDLFFPSAFTPNGDGLNDVLEIQGTFVSSLKLNIFNRWGELIFYSEDRNNGWDGIINQRKAASGAYIYTIDFVDELGVKYSKRGTVILIR